MPLGAAGLHLLPNGERYLREPARLERLYPRALLDETLAVAARCRFSLDELRYEYPREIVPEGETATSWLRKLTESGARRRWLGGMPQKVRELVEHELALIAELQYEPYFLTVHDIVAFARAQGILCQGRGSAANSAVCYCLGVTEVDPSRMSMLVERFISRERNEPPDIDIDFEHERREEVIQYVYRKYGRERAALTATVICYRPRSTLRDLGKALGLDPVQTEKLAGAVHWWHSDIDPERVREAGFDPANPVIARLLDLARQMLGFPRHLSQHVGGFVIARDCLEELVPVENAAMPERTVIQWDKDDLDDLKLLKVDLLGLGMLASIRRALDLVTQWRSRAAAFGHAGRGQTCTMAPFTMADVPAEDPLVYDMICRADTVGVFQIESRAQMAMLPRLLPRSYYDLVIEVAIVRPGPIQGGMVHPYLRRRTGEEQVTYPSPGGRGRPAAHARRADLPGTGHAARDRRGGVQPGEADRLRRAMAAWKRRGGLGPFEQRLRDGMRARGYTVEFAQQIFSQILGFGEYGFPESHAASFALLVYVSAWLKCHEPAAFTCALLNSQPMGFYAPSQLVRDARNHGVVVLPVDVCVSGVECSLEAPRGAATTSHAAPLATATATVAEPAPALRLGLGLVKSLSAAAAGRIVAARVARNPQGSAHGLALAHDGAFPLPFDDVQDLARRAALDRGDLEALAAAGALARLTGNRHLASGASRAPKPSCRSRRAAISPRPRRCCRPDRRRGHRGRLPRPRPDARPPSARAAARAVRAVADHHRGRSRAPAEWSPGAGRGARHHAPAPRHRKRRHVRHARGRNRAHQPGGLGAHGPRPAPAAAGVTPDGSARRAAARGRRHPRDRPPPARPLRAARRIERAVTRFSLSRAVLRRNFCNSRPGHS